MRLSSFIESTLYEIALGVEKARVKSRDLIAINPSRVDSEEIRDRNFVEFDVSVVVSDSGQRISGGDGKASAEIKVASIASLGGGVGGKSETTSTARAEQTHRVTFKVPVFMNAHYRDNPVAQAAAREMEEVWRLEEHR